MVKYSLPNRYKWVRTTDLFNRLWTKAVGAPDYDKEEWLELERRFGTNGS